MTSIKRFYFNISFLLAVIVVMIGLVVVPAAASLQSLGEMIREQDQKLSQKESSGFNIEQVKTELSDAQKQSEQLSGVFVGEGEELKLITQIEGLAQQLNLEVIVTPDLNLKPQSGQMKRLLLKINAAGDYLSIIKFISDLESLDHYFNVSRLMLRSKNDIAGTVILELEGQNYIYFEK